MVDLQIFLSEDDAESGWLLAYFESRIGKVCGQGVRVAVRAELCRAVLTCCQYDLEVSIVSAFAPLDAAGLGEDVDVVRARCRRFVSPLRCRVPAALQGRAPVLPARPLWVLRGAKQVRALPGLRLLRRVCEGMPGFDRVTRTLAHSCH